MQNISSIFKLFLFISVLLISSDIFALQFAILNYSEFATLSYDYTLDGNNWTWCAFLPAVKENPKSFVKINFVPSIPIAWKLEATNGERLQCADYHTHKIVPSIIKLKDKAFTTIDMLLLEVLVVANEPDKFFAQIIDLDGEREYSNTIECQKIRKLI